MRPHVVQTYLAVAAILGCTPVETLESTIPSSCPDGIISGASRKDPACSHLICTESIKADIAPPKVTHGEPAPGRRVIQRLTNSPLFSNTRAFHTLYLPVDYNASLAKRWPVIVEWSGNDIVPTDYNWTNHGAAIAQGSTFIWVVLPFVSLMRGNATCNMRSWWGCEPAACDLYYEDPKFGQICNGTFDAEPTIAYAKLAIRMVLNLFNGDSTRVLVTGHSRGSLAVNYMGLHDDEIASFWTAFAPVSHYDGVQLWPYANSSAASATDRLQRLRGRPVFIAGECDLATNITRNYLVSTGVDMANFSIYGTGFIDHNSLWALRVDPNNVRAKLRAWTHRVLRISNAH
eukprot:m.550802 g.550802  ORF g.550802 m.550802 type:complete len:346 (+) comp22163_c0_seq1:165-1202(+)